MELLFVVIAQSGSAPGAGGLLEMMMPMVIIVGIMYFLIIRPQQKRQKEHENYLSNLKVNDRVVTQGGIVGKISKVESDALILDVGNRTQLKVMRSHIHGPYTEPGAVATEAASDDKK